jgi:hypothetical protein
MEQDEHIEFDTDQQDMPSATSTSSQSTSRSVSGQPEVTGMAAWLIKKGIINNETQAKGILICVVIVDFIIAIAIFYFFVIK